jgi:ABC-2 type transport system permease protein
MTCTAMRTRSRTVASLADWTQVMSATLLRDFRTAVSYRAGFLLSLAGSLVSVVGVFFLSKAFGPAAAGPIDRYGGSYFGFAIVGVALSNLMSLGLTGMSARIREGQMMGTLELMLLSPNRLWLIFLSSSLWGHLQAIVTLVLLVAFGVLLGMDLGGANVLMTLLALVLAVISFNALGLFSAAVVIVIKQGNPVAFLISVASILLAGVLYPMSVLPAWLQVIGQALPLTHALELIRRAALAGEGLATLWLPVLALLGLTAVYLPLGLWACRWAIRLAQTDGSLSQY